jgi:hypothetical protein
LMILDRYLSKTVGFDRRRIEYGIRTS